MRHLHSLIVVHRVRPFEYPVHRYTYRRTHTSAALYAGTFMARFWVRVHGTITVWVYTNAYVASTGSARTRLLDRSGPRVTGPAATVTGRPPV